MSEIILTIDTVSPITTIGLVKKNKILGHHKIPSKKDTSNLLSDALNVLIANNLDSPHQIDKIAILNGPGSFSSLRAGLALAKGINFAIRKPLVAISTFFAMVIAHQTESVNVFDRYIPLVDARKGRFFKSVYSRDGGKVEKEQLIDISSFEKLQNTDSIVLIMEGIDHDPLREMSINYATVAISPVVIALAAKSSGEFEFNEHHIAYLEPSYLVNNYKK